MRICFDLIKQAGMTLAVVASLTLAQGILAQAAHAQGLTLSDMRKLGDIADSRQIDGLGLTRLTDGANLRAFYGTTTPRDYSLTSASLAERFDLSLGSPDFRSSLVPLSRAGVRQDVLGLKARLTGSAGAEQDNLLPQISIGALYGRNRGVAESAGMDLRRLALRDERNVDYFISANKFFLNGSLQLNSTLRATKANGIGLLGFGSGNGESYQASLETGATYSISRKLLVGAEFRMKPNSVGLDNEKAYSDLFLAYFPTKNLALTLAYASLGDIKVFSPRRQSGAYMALQLGF